MNEKKSSPVMTVILILACIAVMGAGIFLTMGKSTPASSADEESSYITAIDGLAQGQTGDVMRNVFFDFKVNSWRTSESYEDLKAAKDMKLIVVNVNVINPTGYPLSMFDSDFQIVYGSGEDDWEVPLTYYDSTNFRNGMLESEYTVAVNKKVSGDLVFSVPVEAELLYLVYEEYYENGEYGDLYVVELK